MIDRLVLARRLLRVALPFATVAATLAPASAWAVPAYVRSNAGAPWGSTSNETAMDTVFGAGVWEDLRFESVDPDSLFSPTYQFIYLEGSDIGAMELDAFLLANQAALEDWVDAGGTLFLNSAPNEGGDMDWGFTGITLQYDSGSDSGSAADAAHPIWAGPNLPVSTSFTGNNYSHASVAGPGLINVIMPDVGADPSLAELEWGNGRVMFGGLTTDNYWMPQPDCANLRANIIAYLATGDSDGDGLTDFADNCPAVANPGQEDGDGDDVGNVCDACPADANDYLDSDGDTFCDNADNCPLAANANQLDGDGDDVGDLCDACPMDPGDFLDSDSDGLCNNQDDCPFSADPMQLDGDVDGVGDACDACPIDPDNDIDNDNDCGNVDNCPMVSNANQQDSDADGAGDACDICPQDADDDGDADGVCGDVDNCPADANANQADVDDDGEGDACDLCPGDVTNDFDGDGVCGDVDNCPVVSNPDQADNDGDGMGAACDADDEPDTTSTSGADSGDESSSTAADETTTTGPQVTTSVDDSTSDEGSTTLPAESSSGAEASDTTGDSTMQTEGDGGCACDARGTSPSAAWVGLVALGLVRRRRRAA
jgi:uncharacterized protein (TIGR03382 family)